MPTPTFSEATLRAHAASESFERGMSYYRRGAAGYLTLAGNVLTAEVEGTQPLPYRVQATFDQGGITSAICDCPYEGSGWCKHIIATLLTYLHNPANVAERPALHVLLANADRDRLAALLLRLAEHDPRLADSIARELTFAPTPSPAPAAPAAATRRTPLDTQPIRQQVRFALRTAGRGGYDRYDYYDDEADPGDAVVEAMRPLLAQAQSFIDSGDAHSALSMLEVITEEYIEGCDTLVEQISDMMGGFEGSAADFFDDLAAAWAEVLLSADLSAGERDEWGERLAGWADTTADYGVSGAFEIAITAADQGWDYLPLRRVLQGTITEQGAWAGQPPSYADQLALIRLKVLDRQGRHEEYLHLAEAEGQIQHFVVKLAQLGRTQAAVAEGLKTLDTPAEALELAQALRAQSDLAGALQIAEHGLTLQIAAGGDMPYAYLASERQRAELAAWAADLALGMGERARALHAAEVGFRAQPNLVAYLKAQELAGDQWGAHRPALLEHLRTTQATEAKVDIFLREQLIDDAIAAVKDSYGYMLLERVMDAAITSRPDWVIRAAVAQAERIMNAGKADRYDHAVNWLRRAKAAYQAAGRSGEWQEYLRNIRITHGRKYKLIGLLTKL